MSESEGVGLAGVTPGESNPRQALDGLDELTPRGARAGTWPTEAGWTGIHGART